MVSFDGGLQAKSLTSQRNRATHKMADMRYYGNVMTTTRWRLYVTMEKLWQQQDGGYALLWKRYGNNKMAAILHLQQYSRRLNFFLCRAAVSSAIRGGGVRFANRHEFGGRVSDVMCEGLKTHTSEFLPQTNTQNTSPVM